LTEGNATAACTVAQRAAACAVRNVGVARTNPASAAQILLRAQRLQDSQNPLIDVESLREGWSAEIAYLNYGKIGRTVLALFHR
jgi:hypothetical protein